MDWVNILKTKIQCDLQPYQVVMITNRSHHDLSVEENILHQSIIREIPVKLVDIKQPDADTLFSQPEFRNPRHVVFYLAVMRKTINSNITESTLTIIDLLASLSPVHRQPKCLIIIFSDDSGSDDSFYQILKFAWTKKILDITILQVKNGMILTHIYNPFRQRITQQPFGIQTNIFPDKLKNMMGYPVNMMIWDRPPFLNLVEDKKEKIIKFKAIYYSLTELLSEKLNFTIKYPRRTYERDISTISEMQVSGLSDGTLNMSPIILPLTTFNPNWKIEIGAFLLWSKYVVVVPIISPTHILVPFRILVYTSILAVTLAISIFSIRYFKFERRYWKVNYLLQILLNMTIPKTPRNSYERIFFVCLVWLSMMYFNVLFASLHDVNLIHDGVAYDTFEEIDNSDMSIYVEPTFISQFLATNDGVMQRIRKKAIFLPLIEDCGRKLKDTGKVVCLTSKIRAQKMIRDSTYLGAASMRIAKEVFWYTPLTYSYERQSPFVEKFDG
ncbi:hypothetical protein TSAR_005190 [Trichomalopsis sarcophagae]|uniref:Ionotropic glutamate receptor C-terminal domain-containing protein n=1 Tax=Trichomalopsis sarcophagae TaxID=543379 RepID=A0A232F9K3_9HYME|nr:hypothetical protein TSAR_005190 [Trichomalopsis sarcophagae]